MRKAVPRHDVPHSVPVVRSWISVPPNSFPNPLPPQGYRLHQHFTLLPCSVAHMSACGEQRSVWTASTPASAAAFVWPRAKRGPGPGEQVLEPWEEGRNRSLFLVSSSSALTAFEEMRGKNPPTLLSIYCRRAKHRENERAITLSFMF